MPYEQDKSGQWWYVARNYRTRAEARSCIKCGKLLLRRTLQWLLAIALADVT